MNNKRRLVDVSQYMIDNSDAFVGFVCGIVSQDHDLQQMYFDSFLNIAVLEGKDITGTINKLEKVSEAFHVDFILSVSADASEIPEAIKDKIILAL